MKLLKKLFIPNHTDTSSPIVRARYGSVAGTAGILSNALLFIIKIIDGILTGSITIIAEAVNNLSDAASSVMTLVGFRLAARPADREHPFGHARYEYVTGLLVSVVVLMVGVMMAKSSIEKIINPTEIHVTAVTYILLGFSIVLKLMQRAMYVDFARAIESTALLAGAEDSRNDIVSSIAVLLSMIVIDTTGVNIDGWVGLAVSLFVVISAIKLVGKTITPILGTLPEKEDVDALREKILSYEGIVGVHDLMLHTYGEHKIYATAHAEVDESTNISKAHEILDVIEKDVARDLGMSLTLHLDPVNYSDPKVCALRDKVAETLAALDAEITIHDFRVVFCEKHTNLIFDAVLPFGTALTAETIIAALDNALNKTEHTYYFVISYDRQYV